jgi:hypothetical protein
MCECSACGGSLVLLGRLGRLEWSRCRDCGLEQAVRLEKVPAAPVCPECGGPASDRAVGLDGHVDGICAACVGRRLLAL